jgi:hypothetical protein
MPASKHQELVGMELVVVRNTDSVMDGRWFARNRLPLGVRPDRFGVIRFRGTGEFEVDADGKLAEVFVPED